MRAQSSPLVVFSTKMNGWLFTPWTFQCIRQTQPSVRGMLCSQSRSAARGPLSALDVARRASVSWSSEDTKAQRGDAEYGRLSEGAERHDARLVCVLSRGMVCTLNTAKRHKFFEESTLRPSAFLFSRKQFPPHAFTYVKARVKAERRGQGTGHGDDERGSAQPAGGWSSDGICFAHVRLHDDSDEEHDRKCDGRVCQLPSEGRGQIDLQ